jgi:hypothetical protein
LGRIPGPTLGVTPEAALSFDFVAGIIDVAALLSFDLGTAVEVAAGSTAVVFSGAESLGARFGFSAAGVPTGTVACGCRDGSIFVVFSWAVAIMEEKAQTKISANTRRTIED